MFLTLDKISKSFDHHKVVKELEIGVEKGEILCLLGASGCGKTTTLKMIGGFLKPDSGRILIEGEDITTEDPQKRPVSTVFQSYALFPNMTVEKNVMYGLKFRGYKKREALKEATKFLEAVGLKDYAKAGVGEISGGQRQRVALARALITRPKVLLLDEPLSNLDAKLRIKMREEIKEIQRQFGITTIFVTHDREEAMVIADKIGIMHEGRLTQVGSPKEVYLQPKDEYTMGFLGPINTFTTKSGKIIKCRPEDLSISLERENSEAVGTITKSEFLGFYNQYYLRVREDIILIREQENFSLQVGAEVGIKIDNGIKTKLIV
ncbi:MAG TPA: ABC transporter ATP-binding protein [Candidatus Dorea intestinavium]|nr:ABC transporter ATP-binding protein [Candidatus Dorea intestinavium]